MEKKNLFIQIIWDILALHLAIMLSTVNSLTYVFMIASIILFVVVVKDLSIYKKDKTFIKNKFIFLMVLATVSIAPLILLILSVAKKDLNVNYVLTYVLYGISSVVLFVCLIFAVKDMILTKKQQPTIEPEEEEKIDFVVEELGTSLDREAKNNTTNTEEQNKESNE